MQHEPFEGIDDVERFCRDAIRRGLRSCGGYLSRPEEREEALAHMLWQLVELHDGYDPAKNSSFVKYAYQYLPPRLVDWYRKRFGDRRYAPRPQETSLGDYEDDAGRIVDHGTAADEVLTTVLFARTLERRQQQRDGRRAGLRAVAR